MKEDRIKWNKKYSDQNLLIPEEPSQIVKKFYSLAKIGKALDIAAGLGRNSIFLAEKGFFVDAVDISDVAMKKLQKFGKKNINPIIADLDTYDLKENEYDLILNINFLNRRLFPQIKEALKEEGVLIFETFLLDKDSHIRTKDYLLRKNELLHYFLDMHVIFYEEKKVTKLDGKDGLVASLIAVKRCKLK